MKKKDKIKIINRYEKRLETLGPVPESLGWLKGRQKLRFLKLKNIDQFNANDTVLDVGCGFGDLNLFLIENGWKGNYVGIDIVSALINQAKKKNKNLDFREIDILVDYFEEKFDWVFSSGALTSKTEEENTYDYINKMLIKMFQLCNKGIAINFCSPNVSFESKVNFHPDFGKILAIVSSISKRFSLLHDYMPYEFTVYIYKDDNVNSSINIFDRYDDIQKDLNQ